MPLHLASALLNINELFDLDDRRKSPDRSGIQMSTNKPSATGRLVRKKAADTYDTNQFIGNLVGWIVIYIIHKTIQA